MQELSDESLLPKNRLEALCDGIFAITMTLMILDLKTPENIPSKLASEELPNILYNLLPSVEAYAISFIVLGIFWLRHQSAFRYIRSVNRPLISLNILFLLLIGFVPFTVGIMMRYPDFPLPFRIYILNLIAISILLSLQWFFIARTKKIVAIEITNELSRKFLLLTLTPILIFALSLVFSYINLRVAFFIIYLDPIFYGVYRNILKKKISREK